MRIEAFSEGKDLDHPEANEDQWLALPGRGYAVIDGVTDIGGELYDGMRGGRMASRIVQQVACEVLNDPADAGTPQRLIGRISTALREASLRYGIVDANRSTPARRFAATLTLAVDLGDIFRFIMIGDSGLRLNGEETFINDSGLDLVIAMLRQEAYRMIGKANGDLDAKRRVGRACAFHGVGALRDEMRPWLDEIGRAELRGRCLERCRERFPSAPIVDIERLLDAGISGQWQFQNNTISPFSYAVLDSFQVPQTLVRVFDRPRPTLRSIEVFSDGYFKLGASPDVTAWEAAFDEVELEDPEKVGRYPSVKGTIGRIRTDDRTVVVVHP